MCGVRTRSMRRGSTTMSFAPCAQPLLHPRREHRVGVGRVGADDHDDVGLVDGLEVLGAGRRAERLLEPVAGGRVADPGAGVDVVVAERRAHHLLDDVDLFVGAARRGDAADRADAVLGPGSRGTAGPRSRSPRPSSASRHSSCDRLAHQRSHHPVVVAGVAVGEPALDARVALVRAAVLRRHHPDDLVALDLGLERAADAAVGAGRHHAAGRHAEHDDRALLQVRRSGRPGRTRRTRRTPTP